MEDMEDVEPFPTTKKIKKMEEERTSIKKETLNLGSNPPHPPSLQLTAMEDEKWRIG